MRKRFSGILAILLAALLFLSACSNQNNNGTSTDNTEKSSNSTATSERNIDVYAGPGDEYIKLTSISTTQIQDRLKYEKDWIEVDYGNKRGYVRADECGDFDINKIPHVVYSVSSNMYPYPTLYNARVNIALFDEASVYSTPKASGSPITVNQNESVVILCHEKSALKDYIQIEYDTEKGKRRGYCESVDLLSLDNPLINYAEVKQKNACIKYGNVAYFSSSGENTSYFNGWHKTDEIKLSKTEYDLIAGIVGVITGNDINKEAIESTQGKLQLYDTKDQQYKNANASDKIKAAQADIVDFLIGSAVSFIDNGVKTTTLDVRMDEYNGEKRIVIRTGVPIEYEKAGKETTLSSLIVEKENTALSLVESDKRADEKIKQMYPDLDKNKTYSMKMSFSKDFDGNNYGYYIVIDKETDVYAVPIIHPGTSFQVFSEDGFVCDAAWDLATAMIKVDENSKKTILNLLSENGFEVNGYNTEPPQSETVSEKTDLNNDVDEYTESHMERTEYTGIELAGMNLNDILDNIFGGDYETSMEMRSIAFSSEPINYFHNDNILPGFAFTSGSGSSHSGYCIAITNGAKLNDSISSDMTYNEIADVIGDFDVQAIGGEWSLIHYADIDGYSVAFCVKPNDYLKQNMTGGHASKELLRAANPKLKSIGIRTK